MERVLYLAILSLIGVILYTRRTIRFFYLVSKIPGPSLWSLATVHARKFMTRMLAHVSTLCEFYSYEPWGFWTMTGDYIVFISSVETVRAMFMSKNLRTKPDFFYGQMADYLGDGSLVLRDVAKWKIHRNAVSPAFYRAILGLNIDILSNGAENIVNALRKKADGTEFDLSLILDDVFTETTVRFLTSDRVVLPDVPRLTKAIAQSLKLMQLKSVNPIQEWFFQRFHKPTKDMETNVRAVIADLKDIVDKQVDEATLKLKSSATEESRDVLECALRNFSKTSGDLGKQEIFEECLMVAAAAVETTKTAVKIIILLLALHPEVQERVFDELPDNLRRRDQRPTLHDVDRMEYLGMVIKEALRLFPSAPIIGRKASDETDLNGTLIPKGSCVLINIMALHRNPNNFKDPLKFIPERFLPESANNCHPYSYIPFGAGKRNCVGQAQAMMMIKIIVSSIVRRYKIFPGKELNSIHDIVADFEITLYVENPVVKVVSRK